MKQNHNSKIRESVCKTAGNLSGLAARVAVLKVDSART